MVLYELPSSYYVQYWHADGTGEPSAYARPSSARDTTSRPEKDVTPPEPVLDLYRKTASQSLWEDGRSSDIQTADHGALTLPSPVRGKVAEALEAVNF